MDARRWREVKEILGTACRLPPEEHEGFLDRACGENDTLRREVASLLTFEDAALEFLERPLFDVNVEDPFLGRRIDHYRIVRPLGRGGMGKVYLARREDDYSKQVAIKLIQRGLDAADRIARFHDERQILADLEHPAIARLLDGGTTDDGLPYLVMERVEGVPIDRYCDELRLGVRQRLELFLQVLSAVAHSHRHLVVHRDLKPSNILVTGDGSPRLIDFGIAKLLPPAEDGAASAPASQRRRMMSPRYASPEQIRGEAITTATDVYALGVLLYQLLSGRYPYALESSGTGELIQAICEQTPIAPSAAVSARAAAGREPETDPSAEAVARARGTTPRRLRRQLAGELDALVAKALRKRPEERYGSAAHFAEDVERHLEGLPVAARPATLAYRARKLAQRHRTAIAAMLLVLLAVAASLTSIGLRARVAKERERTEAIAGFVEHLFRAANPDRADGEELTVRELLDRGGEDLGHQLSDQPLVRSALVEVVGRVYDNLGDRERAERLLTEALELQRRHGSNDDVTLARRASSLAAVLRKQGDLGRAEALYHEALEHLGGCRSRHPDAFWIVGNLTWLLTAEGRFEEAEELLPCLEEQLRGWAGSSSAEANLLSAAAALHYRQLRFEEAEALFRQALASCRRAFGPEPHTRVASALNDLGRVLHARGETIEAEAVLREALEVRGQLLGADHPDTANTRKDLAQVLLALGRAEDAERQARQAVEALESKHPRGDWRLADARSVLGASLAALGRCDEAQPLLVETSPRIARARGEGSPEALAARERLERARRACGWPAAGAAAEPPE